MRGWASERERTKDRRQKSESKREGRVREKNSEDDREKVSKVREGEKKRKKDREKRG